MGLIASSGEPLLHYKTTFTLKNIWHVEMHSLSIYSLHTLCGNQYRRRLCFCQCESSIQWAPPDADVHQRARRPEVVEESPWTRDAHRLAKDWGLWKGFAPLLSLSVIWIYIYMVLYKVCLFYQEWVPPVKKLNRKKREKRKDSRP